MESNAKKPVEVYGVKGLKSAPFRKTFPSQAALEKWCEKNEGDFEIHGYCVVEVAS